MEQDNLRRLAGSRWKHSQSKGFLWQLNTRPRFLPSRLMITARNMTPKVSIIFHSSPMCQTSFLRRNNRAFKKSAHIRTFLRPNKKIVSISISPFKTLFFSFSIQLSEHKKLCNKKDFRSFVDWKDYTTAWCWTEGSNFRCPTKYRIKIASLLVFILNFIFFQPFFRKGLRKD